MGFFTARSKQNPFAERKRREREQRAAEAETAAIIADPEPVAAPFDRNPDSEEYKQAPDISTYAMLIEHGQDDPAPIEVTIPAETQAKIDAVMNKAIPPIAEPEPATAAEFIATMSDPGPAPSVEPQSAPEDEPKRGRGRPRPEETIARDNAVYKLLQAADPDEGVSKEALAVSLGEKEQQVYSSLRQLSKEGRAVNRYVKPHGYRWFAA